MSKTGKGNIFHGRILGRANKLGPQKKLYNPCAGVVADLANIIRESYNVWIK
jgi:hypothetical protein